MRVLLFARSRVPANSFGHSITCGLTGSPLIPLVRKAEGSVTNVLGVLAVILLAAKAWVSWPSELGNPPSSGEMLAGVVLGPSLIGLVDPSSAALHLLAEVGVVAALFHRAGNAAKADARSCGHLCCGCPDRSLASVRRRVPRSRLLGLTHPQAIVMGAALTAISVGITARVLGDLGQLRKPDGQVILGAAVIDHVIGLVILAVVSDAVAGATITIAGILIKTALAFGFLIVAVLVGSRLAAPVLRVAQGSTRLDVIAAIALASAFLLAVAADRVGSAPIIGAFAAGLIIAPTPYVHRVEEHVRALGGSDPVRLSRCCS